MKACNAGTMPPPRRLSSGTQAIQWGQHALLAFMLVSALLSAIARQEWSVGLGIASLAFVGWYVAGIALAQRHETAPTGSSRVSWQGVTWLLGLVVLWMVLVVLSRSFVWLSFSLFLLCLHLLPTWAGILAVAAITVFVSWTQWWVKPPEDPMNSMAGPAMGALVALGIAWGYRTIVRESSERARLITQLTEARDDLVSLQESLAESQREAGVASERARLARDIHDTLAQGFSSILLLARAGLPRSNGNDRALFDQISQTAQENLDESRRVVLALTPGALEGAGLPAAIGRQLERLQEQTAVRTGLRADGDPATLSTTVEVALLRFVQGALANVRTHSGATHVHVTITYEPEEVRVDVVDDGRGFDPATAGPRPDGSGFGLRAMRERLAELGGQLMIESAPGEGTALVATIPLGRVTKEQP